jgi:deoxyribodipyrimidine photo-lyase
LDLKCSKFRAKFLIESVTALKQNLGTTPALVYHQKKPEGAIPPEIITENEIDSIYFQEWRRNKSL